MYTLLSFSHYMYFCIWCWTVWQSLFISVSSLSVSLCYLGCDAGVYFRPRLSRKQEALKLIRPSVTKTLTWLILVFTVFGMHDPCDKPNLLVFALCRDLWPTSRSNVLPDGALPFFTFACSNNFYAPPRPERSVSGASSNRIVRLLVCLSVIPSRLLTKCNI